MVHGTLIVEEGRGVEESDIPHLLTHIDEALLPEVRLDDHNLTFTVVVGRAIGAYEAVTDEDRATARP